MADKRIIEVPVTLDSAVRKKDRSVKFAFTTISEVSTDAFMVMDSYHQSAGFLLFKENAFREEDIPTEDVEVDIAKSQSVQLRDALWVLHRVKGGTKDNWDTFYRKQMQAFKARTLATVHELENN